MANVYLINTNKSHNSQSEKDMLSLKKCSAYYSPWKYYIDNIDSNDLVFLYSNEKGIVARGIATGVVEKEDYEGNKDEEHYMYLNRFQNLKTPLKASEVSQIISDYIHEDYQIRWNQTMIQLPYELGLQVWQYITKNI